MSLAHFVASCTFPSITKSPLLPYHLALARREVPVRRETWKERRYDCNSLLYSRRLRKTVGMESRPLVRESRAVYFHPVITTEGAFSTLRWAQLLYDWPFLPLIFCGPELILRLCRQSNHLSLLSFSQFGFLSEVQEERNPDWAAWKGL